MIRYLPTTDGVNLDTAYAPDFYTLNPIPLATLEQTLDNYDKNVKFMLEEGSRFRGYGSQAIAPSLGYRVVASITVYELTPPGKIFQTIQGYPIYTPEQFQIFERFDIQNYVNNLGVKEIWFWQGGVDPSFPSYNPMIHLPENFRTMSESNMASPTTGDVSNSLRDNSDLPVFNKTYVIYGQNFRRNQAETVHNHGHQLEAILGYANQLQTGNTQMFWQKFVGRDANFNWLRGRAGDTHHPPNASADYDYLNTNPYPSDIMDWKPDGGQTAPISADTYGNIPYAFASPNPPQATESKWYIFWMQSMPGRVNQIPFGANRMTNWWHFTADWDAAITVGLGLYEPSACAYSLSSASQTFSATGGTATVNVTSGAGCKWIASSNTQWAKITSGNTSVNGNKTVNFTVQPNTSGSQRTGTIAIAGQTFTVIQNSGAKTRFDFDGDGKSDVSVFRPTNGAWYLNQSANGFTGFSFGLSGDVITPADYDGDGKADAAVYRNGTWYLLRSSLGFTGINFGIADDIPVPADFDGDGKADPAVFRATNGTWYVLGSIAGFYGAAFGSNGDKPIPADYDGDGKADLAVFRSGNWYIQRSQSGFTGFGFGSAGDLTVPADYDGDGKADAAVFRPANGTWYLQRSTAGFAGVQFGLGTDLPTPADYDGDGKTDIAVFRSGNWFLQYSTSGYTFIPFGASGDAPIPNAFVR